MSSQTNPAQEIHHTTQDYLGPSDSGRDVSIKPEASPQAGRSSRIATRIPRRKGPSPRTPQMRSPPSPASSYASASLGIPDIKKWSILGLELALENADIPFSRKQTKAQLFSLLRDSRRATQPPQTAVTASSDSSSLQARSTPYTRKTPGKTRRSQRHRMKPSASLGRPPMSPAASSQATGADSSMRMPPLTSQAPVFDAGADTSVRMPPLTSQAPVFAAGADTSVRIPPLTSQAPAPSMTFQPDIFAHGSTQSVRLPPQAAPAASFSVDSVPQTRQPFTLATAAPMPIPPNALALEPPPVINSIRQQILAEIEAAGIRSGSSPNTSASLFNYNIPLNHPLKDLLTASLDTILQASTAHLRAQTASFAPLESYLAPYSTTSPITFKNSPLSFRAQFSPIPTYWQQQILLPRSPLYSSKLQPLGPGLCPTSYYPSQPLHSTSQQCPLSRAAFFNSTLYFSIFPNEGQHLAFSSQPSLGNCCSGGCPAPPALFGDNPGQGTPQARGSFPGQGTNVPNSGDHKVSSRPFAVFGNSTSVQFGHDNILLGEEPHPLKHVVFSRIDPVQIKISECHVSVINMIDFTELHLDSVDHLIGQLMHENQISAFIFVVRLGQLTDADKMCLEWLQSVFGDRVLQFVMILFTYEEEKESDSIIDDLKKNNVLEELVKKCGGRYHTCSKTMNNQSEMRELMRKIDRLFNENKEQCYTGEMHNTQLQEKQKKNKPQGCEDSMKHSPQQKCMMNTGMKQQQMGNQPALQQKTTTCILRRARTHLQEETAETCSTKEGPALLHKEEKLMRDQKQHLFHRLRLKDNIHNKLNAVDVLQISSHSLQSRESCDEEELVMNYLQNILMMNYRARYININETTEKHHTQQTNKDASKDGGDFFKEVSFSNNVMKKTNRVHPMDVQMAVFHCADSFLKQMMVTKLSQCQFALPLLVPHPFTKQIEFPLWTFRQINKSWKMRNTNNEIISKEEPVYKAETPMVLFFRFGSVSSSKSQLMNNLINEKHNTFFHRNCPGSSRTRLLMEGVVEITWFYPSGIDTDRFNNCVAFCNLHGDAGDNEKQLQILTEKSLVNVVLLPHIDKNDKNASKIQKLYKDKKPLIFLFSDDESALTETRKGKYKIGLKDRNQSDVSEELRRAINECLSSSASASMFRLEDLSKHSDIRVDEEDDEDCRRGREAAQQMMSLLENKDLREIKKSLLPCQGKFWHLWCQKNKELHRPQGEDIEQEISRKQTEMKNIRKQQHDLHMSEFIKFFINQMNSHEANVNRYFLNWLRNLLDEFTSADLSELQVQTELMRISEELQAASFGLEHIMREIGQIYESCSSVKKNKTDLQIHFSSLPSLAAEMMIYGFPLELMDGDAAHVPLIWITAVLDELIQKLGDQRVFVLSVLGLQSSGKSTMLNAMFGLQFAVSAGRCTRGAFMQLIRVSEEMKDQMKFDYILVVDTEGLRALELAGRSTRHHDNELATFVVGLGQLTLINIFGENPAEMQDILQIVVQAFLRMKKVRLNPSCMFIHQNISDITAGEKNMEGRRRLQETLDKMTKLAAKDEVCDAECFSDVINFDVQNDVKYFAHLWEGNPPMAPPNPNYCENIQKLKKTIILQSSKSDGVRLTHLRDRIKDLWEALLNERFVFSFRNSLEISVYRRLETEYSKWFWTLRSAMLEIENKLHNQIENKAIDEIEKTGLQAELMEKTKELKSSMSEFFERETDADILIQWKSSFEIKIKDVKENIVRETKMKLNKILQQQDLKKKIDDQRTKHESFLLEKSKELALTLKDKANDKATLKREFDFFWEKCVKNITKDTTPIKDIDILKDVQNLLRDIYKSVPVEHRNENTDIFYVKKYSDYVTLKKSNGLTGQVQNMCKAAKEELGYTLSKDDETHITNLISDVVQETDKMIKSFHISKLGYNNSYIEQLTEYIKIRITEYKEKSETYLFKNEFFIDLVFSIFKKRAEKTLINQHRMFREVNDPVLYLEKKRYEYYSIFQKYCDRPTSTAIFGELICQKLKRPIEQSVYKNIGRDLADEIRSNCPSLNENRSNREKHILKRLAEEENFSAFNDYINYPKEHFKDFIRDEVHQYISDQFSISVQPKMNQNIEVWRKKTLKAAQKSTEYVEVKSGDVDLWLMFFTQKLSDDLIFSVKDFSGVKHDDVNDFKLLEDVIITELPSIISDISREFSTDTFDKKLDLNNRPDEILIDHFCQCCWVQCPFCKATCTNTIENHDGDHSVPFHRVTGINGFYFNKTQTLCTEFCSTAVKTSKIFKSSGQWILFSDYKSAGHVYAKWSITPDLSKMPYWKWFVCRFQKDLEMYHGKTFQDKILDEWKKYTKEDAIKSLDKYYSPKH
nr:interferon-induced very large GTPase 1-like [Misgurnus anguillicaudatus]